MEKKIFDKNKKKLIDSLNVVIKTVKLDKYLGESRKRTLIDRITNIIYSMKNDYACSHLSFVFENKKVIFSYAKDLKGDHLDDKNRINIKLGRFICKFFDYEDFVTDYIVKNVTAVLTPMDEFKDLVNILSGADLSEHYNATAVRTCMTGPDNLGKIVLYVKNPEKISLLTVKGYGCRALVWTTDDGMKVLDRIYPAGHALIPTIRKWAEDSGYILRSSPDGYMTYGSNIALEDDKFHKITLNNTRNYPFVDTFVFGEIEGKKLVLSNDCKFGNMALQNQHGSFISFHNCERCKDKIVDGDHYDFITLDNNRLIYCHNCYHKVIINCGCCSNRVLKETAKQPNPNSSFVCDKCIKTYYSKCKDCGEHHKNNAIKNVRGDILCNVCYSKKYVKCVSCGKNNLERDSDKVKTKGNYSFCEKCFDDVKECHSCEAIILPNKGKEFEGETYCIYCARYKTKSNEVKSLNYMDNNDYREIIDYITTNTTIR